MNSKEITTQICRYTYKVLAKNYWLSKDLSSDSYLLRVDRQTDEFLLYEIFMENRFKGHLREPKGPTVELTMSYELPENYKKNSFRKHDKVLGLIMDVLAYRDIINTVFTIMRINSVGLKLASKKALGLFQIEEDELSLDALLKKIQRENEKKRLSEELMQGIISM